MPRSDVYFASHSPPKPYFQVYNQQNDLNYTYTGLTDNQSTARAETAPSNSSHTLREARSFHTERLTCSKKSRGVSRISKARKHSQPPNLRSNLLLTPIAFENCSSCLTPNIKFLISYYLPRNPWCDNRISLRICRFRFKLRIRIRIWIGVWIGYRHNGYHRNLERINRAARGLAE